MKNVLVVKPVSVATADVLARVPGRELARRVAYVISNTGRHVSLARAHEEPAHLYAVGDCRFGDVVVAREFALMYGNEFTYAWLASLLARLEGGALWVQIGNRERAEALRLATPAAIVRRLDGVRCDEVARDLFRITVTDAAALARAGSTCHSVFACAIASYEEFCRYYREVAASLEGHWLKVGAEESQFIYALMGANQKSWIVERATRDFGLHAPLDILDVGGGFGHFAAEMAAKGHALTVNEVDPAKAEGLGPWLMRTCGLEPRVRFVRGRMEELEAAHGSYDIVTIFGSLLYAERSAVPGILRAAWRALRAGGALVIHENPRDAVEPGAPDYEHRFPAAELRELMRMHTADPLFVSPFTGEPVSFEKAAASVVAAVARKRG